VQPEALLRCHPDRDRRRRTCQRGRSGRPAVLGGVVQLVPRLAKENPARGFRRTGGELATMGLRLAPSSVWAMLRCHGVTASRRHGGTASGPRRGGQVRPGLTSRGSRRRRCLHTTSSTLAVPLRRLYVQFSIELDTRRAHVTGTTANPMGEWVTQQSRNLSLVLTQRVGPAKFLIQDPDSKFTANLDQVFRTECIHVVCAPIGGLDRSLSPSGSSAPSAGSASTGCSSSIALSSSASWRVRRPLQPTSTVPFSWSAGTARDGEDATAEGRSRSGPTTTNERAGRPRSRVPAREGSTGS